MRSASLLPLLLFFLLLRPATGLRAQTYFYIDQIVVQPGAPTDQDDVSLLLIGNLSDTGVILDSVTAHVNGFTVGLAVAAISGGGLSVLVPDTEVVDLGLLPPGDYTITVAGPGIQITAPAGQHHFTVTGSASACDSLVLAGLTWMPFSDTALLVHVLNPTATLFDYPGFVLLAGNGDTLAKETVNFFGIGQESYSILDIPSGTTMPASPFNATLQLWTLFYQDLGCTWNLPVDLCPPDSCSPVILDLRNSGSGTATGLFTYNVREAGVTVATGSFELTDQQQYDADTVCLPPGNYLMEIIPQQGPDGGQLSFGADLASLVPGPHAPVIWTTLSAVTFSLYERCIDVGQVITEHGAPTMQIVGSAGGMEISRSDNRVLGSVQVFDTQGRIVAMATEASSRHTFTTTDWSPGIYLFTIHNTDGQVLTARWLKQ